jgi:hypothetical protein
MNTFTLGLIIYVDIGDGHFSVYTLILLGRVEISELEGGTVIAFVFELLWDGGAEKLTRG